MTKLQKILIVVGLLLLTNVALYLLYQRKFTVTPTFNKNDAIAAYTFSTVGDFYRYADDQGFGKLLLVVHVDDDKYIENDNAKIPVSIDGMRFVLNLGKQENLIQHAALLNSQPISKFSKISINNLPKLTRDQIILVMIPYLNHTTQLDMPEECDSACMDRIDSMKKYKVDMKKFISYLESPGQKYQNDSLEIGPILQLVVR